MFRLLGFLIGSAASIGAILLLLGVPELQLDDPDLDQARFDEALEKLKEKQRELRQLAAEAAPASAAPAEPAAAHAAAAEPAKEAGPALPAGEDPASAFGAEPHADVLPEALPAQHWHAFWNPFRSELAARGFVAQLERVTGLDYRIVKVKTGVYEVSFAYRSDAELDLKLSQIQAATGLDLPPD